MTSEHDQSQKLPAAAIDDDSAVNVLRQLEEERGRLFKEAEYQEMRRTVLEEVAHGARLRPFTIFTFAVLLIGLLAMLVVGLVTASGSATRDDLLAWASGLALVAACYFIWSCVSGIRLDAERTLDARLHEVGQLLKQGLISPEEHAQIQAHILLARQRSAFRRQ